MTPEIEHYLQFVLNQHKQIAVLIEHATQHLGCMHLLRQLWQYQQAAA